MGFFCTYNLIDMKILLSPAKTINEKASIVGDYTIPIFENEAQKLVRELKKLKPNDLMNLMAVSAEIAELNRNRFKNWKKALSDDNYINYQVIRAFNGEVYRGFDIDSLEERFYPILQEKVRILSGLYGYLKPFDLISPYRLEMGTRFSYDDKTKNLYDYWKTKVTKALNKEIQSKESIINLASTEYFKVVDKETLKSNIITPVFKEFKNGKYSVVMMYAKHARGAMARHIVTNEIDHVETLKLYSVDGYSFDDKLSTVDEWVFVR